MFLKFHILIWKTRNLWWFLYTSQVREGIHRGWQREADKRGKRTGEKREKERQNTKAGRGVRGGCMRKEKVNGGQLLDR